MSPLGKLIEEQTDRKILVQLAVDCLGYSFPSITNVVCLCAKQAIDRWLYRPSGNANISVDFAARLLCANDTAVASVVRCIAVAVCDADITAVRKSIRKALKIMRNVSWESDKTRDWQLERYLYLTTISETIVQLRCVDVSGQGFDPLVAPRDVPLVVLDKNHGWIIALKQSHNGVWASTLVWGTLAGSFLGITPLRCWPTPDRQIA